MQQGKKQGFLSVIFSLQVQALFQFSYLKWIKTWDGKWI